MRFATEITVTGPLRAPAQMLAEQEVDGHASVHDDADAPRRSVCSARRSRGRRTSASSIRWPSPLWGHAWFERGCISSHFRTMVVEGEEVQASMTTDRADVGAHRGRTRPTARRCSPAPRRSVPSIPRPSSTRASPRRAIPASCSSSTSWRSACAATIGERRSMSHAERNGARLSVLAGREAGADHRAAPVVHGRGRRRRRRGAGPSCRSR